MDLINAGVWLCVVMTMGFCLLALIARRSQVFTPLEQWALSFPLGIGVASLYLGLAVLFHIPFSKIHILLIAVVLLVLYALIGRVRRSSTLMPLKEREKITLGFFDHFCIGAIAVQSFYNIFRAVMKPWSSFDFLQQYGLKAKVFYLAHGIPPDFLQSFHGIAPNLQYPPLMSFSLVSFYMFQGYVNDSLVNIINPLFNLSFVVLFYAVLRRFAHRRTALLFTFLLATVKQFADYGSFTNPDMLLSFYFTASVFNLYLWTRHKNFAFFTLSLVLSVFMIYTKTEGVLLLGINSAVLVFYTVFVERGRWKTALVYMGVAMVLIGGYVGITRSLGLAVQDRFEHFSLASAPVKMINNYHRIPKILYNYQKTIFGMKKWSIIWVLFFLTMACHFKRMFHKDYLLITLWLFLIVSGYSCIYLLTEVDVEWQLSTTLARFFLHNLPLSVFFMALMWKDTNILEDGVHNKS